ncbi:MAG: hypothetical protein F4Y45_03095 [Acidobacteria bacterium]|nr:hypothetical protein [Acidobacteriota bacterium]MYJ05794.1 hypothetical protein [Acidobacteriota bacterium]
MFDDPARREQAESPAPPEESDPALTRFRACRWHEELTDGTEYCAHSEVKPYAGQRGFNPTAWCPECDFYKTRRKRKKNDPYDFDGYSY